MNITSNEIKKAKIKPCLKDPFVKDAHLQFYEVGGGFYLCQKDRSGEKQKAIFTTDEVKAFFETEEKVAIIVNNHITGAQTTSIANFDNRI